MADTNNPNTKPRLFRRTLWLLGLLALFMSVSTVSLVHYYGANRPTVMQPEQGRTHAVKIHARTVYLTNGEMAAAMGTHVIAILSIGGFLGVLLKSRWSRTPRNLDPSKSA